MHGDHLIAGTQQHTVADLQALQPILNQLGAAGKDLPNALELLTTYPFPRTVDRGVRGDYANLFVTVDGSATDLLNNLTAGGIPPLPRAPKVPTLPITPPKLPVVSGLNLAGDDGTAVLGRLLLGGLA